MINFIRGIIAHKFEDMIIIENNGIGYQIFVSTNSPLYLLQIGDEATIFTHMQVREDDMSLYGFDDRRSLELFKKLITVNGVGAKAGIAILSSMPSEEIRKAIIFEDVALLTRAQGIGKKTAQKIVLELKDKLGEKIHMETSSNTDFDTQTVNMTENNKTVAIDALINLGYSRNEATKSITNIKNTTEEEISVETYIKEALKRM